jgi:DNA mismatch endonuclease (patch repair protein)
VVRTSPSYSGLQPASPRASAAARGSSRKSDTGPEVQLRRLLHRSGRRFLKNVRSLPGCPDIVFPRAKLVIFCDGDFWHGHDWSRRKLRLGKGTNSRYWISKIERNMARDADNQVRLECLGWRVLRFWESEIKKRPSAMLAETVAILDGLE